MDNNGEVVYLYLDDIIPNRFQPREVFDDQALKELAVSIREHGVIQPIIVRKVENKYEIIAGERRYKASTMAGLTKIPAIVKNLDDKESSKVALIENLQRKDLSPIEEARTYQKILELEDGMTQEQLAATLGKTQSSVSNKLRLLALPDEVQDALLKEKISERHARSLLNIEDKNEQIKMMDKVIAEKMTVRELDKEIKEKKEGTGSPTVDLNLEPQVTTPLAADLNLEEQATTPVNIDLNLETQNIESMPQIDMNLYNNVDNQSTNVVESTVPPASPDLNINLFSLNSDNNQNNEQEVQDMNNVDANTNNQFIDNPTMVDIDKIRESATDINPITTPPQVEAAPATGPSQDDFKFIPSFETNTNDNTVVQQEPQNMFNQFFNANIEQTGPSVENTTIASSMPTEGISVPSVTPVVDNILAITDLKNTIVNLQNQGYNITYLESDDPDYYKMTIQIKKN